MCLGPGECARTARSLCRGRDPLTIPRSPYAPERVSAHFGGVASQVASAGIAASRGGTSKVGVFIAAFGDVSELLSVMSEEPTLQGVALYAGDGSA